MKKILMIDDDKNVCEFISDLLSKDYYIKTLNNVYEGINEFQINDYNLVILDIKMPSLSGEEVLVKLKNIAPEIPVIMITAVDDLKTAVNCLKSGAVDYITKPFYIEELRHIIKQQFHIQNIENEIEELKEQIRHKYNIEILTTKSKEMQKVIDVIDKIANQDVTVLLQGESGTGKEIIANYIHCNSKRKDKSFIAVDCGALPQTLIQSELFGYVKGAFTGANTNKKGKFELANDGTLFLDEISNMDLESQAKLLRAIQTNKIEKLGHDKLIEVNTRLIVATNKILEDEVKKGNFREDLFYRINVIPITLPSLRERKEDIPIITDFFVKFYAKANNKKVESISKEVLDLFQKYNWPGNIRELENTISKAIVLSNGNSIEISDLKDLKDKVENKTFLNWNDAKNEYQKKYILKVLSFTNNDLKKTSEILGFTQVYLNKLINKYSLKF